VAKKRLNVHVNGVWSQNTHPAHDKMGQQMATGLLLYS